MSDACYTLKALLQPGLKIAVAHFMRIYIVDCVTALESKNRPHPQNPNPHPLHPSVYDAGLSTGILEWYHKYSLCCSMDFVRFLCNTVPYIIQPHCNTQHNLLATTIILCLTSACIPRVDDCFPNFRGSLHKPRPVDLIYAKLICKIVISPAA